MRHHAFPVIILSLFLGCGGSDQQSSSQQSTSPPNAIPGAAAVLDGQLTSRVTSQMWRGPSFEAFLVGIFNPGSPLAQGLTLSPDPAPGSPPHSFVFSGPYDIDGDGFKESSLSGQVTFANDPDVAWSSATGKVVADLTLPIIGTIYHASMNYSLTSTERTLSGSGTITDPLGGTTTTVTISQATPLVIKPATGAAGVPSNACGYNISGPVQFQVNDPSGTLKSTWNFSAGSSTVVANNRSFTDPAGQTTALPDSTVTAPCENVGTISDWVGVFNQDWVCLPRESGTATLTLSVTPPATVNIADEDPPGSGTFNTYSSGVLGSSSHAVRGFFIGGQAGFQYREDFNWTLSNNLSQFSQFSIYTYIEGPDVGSGGLCVAFAKRV